MDALHLLSEVLHSCLGNVRSVKPKEIQAGMRIFHDEKSKEPDYDYFGLSVLSPPKKTIIHQLEYCQEPKLAYSCGQTTSG